MGGAGKVHIKRANFAKIYTNLKELRGYLGGDDIFLPKSKFGGGVGIVENRVANFREKWSWGRGGAKIREGRVQA